MAWPRGAVAGRMMPHPRIALTLVLVVMLGGAALVAWRTLLQPPPGSLAAMAQPGAPAPQLHLARLGGGTADLAQQRGKVVLINFWATWCGPCKSEMPALQRLADTLADGPFALYPVDLQEEAPAIEPFLRDVAFTTPVLLDEDGSVTRSFGVRALPATFLVDRQGVLWQQHLGPLTDGDAGSPWTQAWVEQQVRALMQR